MSKDFLPSKTIDDQFTWNEKDIYDLGGDFNEDTDELPSVMTTDAEWQKLWLVMGAKCPGSLPQDMIAVLVCAYIPGVGNKIEFEPEMQMTLPYSSKPDISQATVTVEWCIIPPSGAHMMNAYETIGAIRLFDKPAGVNSIKVEQIESRRPKYDGQAPPSLKP